MEFICQTVPDRHAGICCQILHDILAEPAVLDPVEHASENTRRILDAFLFSHLGAAWSQIHRMHAQIGSSHFKSAAGTCTVFLKEENYVFSLAVAMRCTCLFHGLQLDCKIDKPLDLFGCKIEQF